MKQFVKIMLVVVFLSSNMVQADRTSDVSIYVRIMKDIHQALLNESVDPATIIQQHDIIQLVEVFELIKSELSKDEIEEIEACIRHIRSELLRTKAPRLGTPTVHQTTVIDPNYYPDRDLYLRNLLVTGSLIAPGFPSSGGGSSGGPFLPLAGGTMTGNINMSQESGIAFGGSSGSGSVTLQAPSSVSPSYNIYLPDAPPSGPNNYLVTNNADGQLEWTNATPIGGIQSIDGLTAANQFLANGNAGTAPNWTTLGTSSQVLNIPQASTTGITSGLISNTEYAYFSDKVNRSGDTMTGPLKMEASIVMDSCNAIQFNNSDDTSYVGLRGPCTTSSAPNYVLILPTTESTAVGQVLGNIGNPNGQLGWITTVTTDVSLLYTATSCALANTLVLRDGSANIAVGTLTLTTSVPLINYQSSGTCPGGEALLSLPASDTLQFGQSITSVIPGADNTASLGSATDRWATVNTFTVNYFDGLGSEVSIALNPAGGNASYTMYWPQSVGEIGQVLQAQNSSSPQQLEWVPITTLVSGTVCDYPNSIVARDSNGMFVATTISLTGISLIDYGSNGPSQCLPGNQFILAPENGNTIISLFSPNAAPNTSTIGANNTVFGYQALAAISSGSGNTAIGFGTLSNVTTGSNNTAIGAGAGSSLTTGTGNIFIGLNAGQGYDGNSSIFIGFNGAASGDNVIYIGNPSINTGCANPATSTTIYGCINLPEVNCGTGYIASFDSNNQLLIARSSRKYKDNIKSLAPTLTNKVYNLRPVEFNFKNAPSTLSYGLVAEEVEAACKELVIYNEAGEVDSVNYLSAQILALDALIKQHGDINALNARCDMLTSMITSQNENITQLQQQINQLLGQ